MFYTAFPEKSQGGKTGAGAPPLRQNRFGQYTLWFLALNARAAPSRSNTVGVSRLRRSRFG
jgi:hypothetical protein